MHPFLTDRLAAARLADLHDEAEQRRAMRHLGRGHGWRFWRRPPPGPPPRAAAGITLRREPVEVLESEPAAETALRPVA